MLVGEVGEVMVSDPSPTTLLMDPEVEFQRERKEVTDDGDDGEDMLGLGLPSCDMMLFLLDPGGFTSVKSSMAKHWNEVAGDLGKSPVVGQVYEALVFGGSLRHCSIRLASQNWLDCWRWAARSSVVPEIWGRTGGE